MNWFELYGLCIAKPVIILLMTPISDLAFQCCDGWPIYIYIYTYIYICVCVCVFVCVCLCVCVCVCVCVSVPSSNSLIPEKGLVLTFKTCHDTLMENGRAA